MGQGQLAGSAAAGRGLPDEPACHHRPIRTTRAISLLGLVAALLLTHAHPAGADVPPRRYAPKITNGTDATPGDHPYMAALLSAGIPDRFRAQFCGGSVVDPEWILTAGHCVAAGQDVSPANTIDVLVGTTSLDGSDGDRIPADRIVLHPAFDDTGAPQHDVALIHLSRATTAPAVRLADAATRAVEAAGTVATLTGWGGLTTDQQRQQYAHTLQVANVPVIADSTCAFELGAAFDPSNALCAGAPEDDADGGVDACQGDSGGPLVVDDGGAVPLQIGIVSWGPTCGHTPTAYARVSAFTSFIAEVIATGDGVLDNTVRLAGPNRFATAAQLAVERFARDVSTAFVVTGASFADALASAPAAFSLGAPVLLTDRNVLSPETEAALRQLSPQQIIVVGGTGAVSSEVATELQQLTAGEVVRIAGDDRYDTAAQLSAFAFPTGVGDAGTVFLASGETFADALSAAAASATPPSVPLLLTAHGALPVATHAELVRLAPAAVSVFGGTAAIDDAVLGELAAMGIERVERIAGTNRYETSALIVNRAFDGADAVIVATGTNFPDGLVAGALGQPLLLIPPGRIPAAIAEAIGGQGATSLLVLGGTGAISDFQAFALDELVGG